VVYAKLHREGEVRVLKLEHKVQQDAAIQLYVYIERMRNILVVWESFVNKAGKLYKHLIIASDVSFGQVKVIWSSHSTALWSCPAASRAEKGAGAGGGVVSLTD
jgi:hypothetical protein